MKARYATAVITLMFATASTCACNDESSKSSSSAETSYLRSDAPELVTSWQPEMKLYRAEHQAEAEVVESLALDPSKRSVIDAQLNRVSYTTSTGTVEIYYDEGLDSPFHTLRYQRSIPFEPQTWSGSEDLHNKWAEGARAGAEYLGRLTKLTPVVNVGAGEDEDYAKHLSNGYDFILAIDGWPVWVDDLRIRVDAGGVYEFTTDELVYDASTSGTIQARTKAEVEALLSQAGAKAPDGSQSPPIFYGFDTDTDALRPFYLFVMPDGEGGPQALPMDRTQNEF